MQGTEPVFAFGKNWQQFVNTSFSEERVTVAKQHIAEFLGMPDLHGQYFLDVGCGSGLSSLAALALGAERIVSFDVDADAVDAARKLYALAGKPEHWQILHGSVLDRAFLRTLDKADIVYSWGVLHHTGQMWQAIEHAATLLNASGLFYLALYTKELIHPRWTTIKRWYNRMPVPGKRLMEAAYISGHLSKMLLLRRRNPIRYVRNYRQRRGMAYLTDVRDWLGGYPYEEAKIDETIHFGRSRLGLELINIRTGEANTEYLFATRQRVLESFQESP